MRISLEVPQGENNKLERAQQGVKSEDSTNTGPSRYGKEIGPLLMMAERPNPLNEAILLLCRAGDLGGVRKMMEDHPDPKAIPRAEDMVQQAAISGNPALVRFLFEEFPDFRTDPATHYAAFRGGLDVYKAFLEKFPDLLMHGFGHMGDPLNMAAMYNDLPFVEFLLGKGVIANASFVLNAIPVSEQAPYTTKTVSAD
ncbi:MAG: hypothetical protein M4579_005298 [Chaenotheca gracillima]|nr:MAG: hypothetical protein M4579_005298 [Chaenotheca gracillima]